VRFFTIKQIAEQLGVNEKTVRRWIFSASPSPTMVTMYQLMSALHAARWLKLIRQSHPHVLT
jgi:DNA-binding transcriptional MerR regulator